jgi:hypothetical protein
MQCIDLCIATRATTESAITLMKPHRRIMPPELGTTPALIKSLTHRAPLISVRYESAAVRDLNPIYVRVGSWLCENAKTLNRDRRSYSSKTVLVAQQASGFNLEIELKNIILRRVSIFEFLHNQGHFPTLALAVAGSALPSGCFGTSQRCQFGRGSAYAPSRA